MLLTGGRAAWGWTVPLLVAGVLLGLLAGGRLAIGLKAIGEPRQLDYGEPIIYSQAARIPNGEPLYQPLDRPPFTVAAYTPLYYKLAAELQLTVGPGFGPGRALSYAAGLLSALGVAWLAARGAASLAAGSGGGAVGRGLLAGLLFVGLGFPGSVPWFALYRVDLVAEALALGAIVVLAHGTSVRHVLLAGLLAGLAILAKQSYFAAALAGTLWLWGSARRRALLYGATATILALGVCLAQQVTTGAFVANTVLANVNPLNPDELLALVVLLAETLGLPLLAVGVWLARTRPWRTPRTRLLIVYWAAASVQLLGLVKFGAIHNYWIEFAAMTAVLAALSLASAERWLRQQWPRLAAALLWLFAANLGVLASLSVEAEASGLSGAATLTGQPPTSDAEFAGLIEQVRRQDGPVLADPLDVVVLAGRPVYLEPVIFAILDDQGRWDPAPLVRRICAGQVPLLVLGIPIEPLSEFSWHGQPWWPPRVMRALRARMQFSAIRAGRWLYTPTADPAPGPAGAPPSGC